MHMTDATYTLTRYNTETGAQLACNSTQNSSLNDYVLLMYSYQFVLRVSCIILLSILPEQRLRLVRATGTLAHVHTGSLQLIVTFFVSGNPVL